MTTDKIFILLAMILYLLGMVAIGIFFNKKANESTDNYFLGGRTLGPWITAMSAEASDMSGWLMMGLPGVAYWCGLASAVQTAIGLAVGTYLNWLLISKRLRRYSTVFDDSITLPEFFSKRFGEKKPVILIISSLFILIFFTVYAASCLVTFGKLFSALFNVKYIPMMILGAVIVLIYTFMGGFLAESVSDFFQAIVMVIALIAIVSISIYKAGGVAAMTENLKQIPGFLEFFASANPVTDSSGVQQVVNNAPVFGEKLPGSAIAVLSALAWGLGYFGMPQVLLRFMAIRKESELNRSRRIAIIWVTISMACAVFIGIIGRDLLPTTLLTASQSENIFILLSIKLLPSFLAGLVMAGILAAAMSSSDSYLLIAASAFAKNIYHSVVKKDATDKQVMRMSKITLVVITLIAIVISLNENSVIFKIVSFAWAGFGATFGPLVLFSLFWKKTTRAGAIAGMLSGGISVFVWKLGISKLGGIFTVYELLPSFIISCIFIAVVSLFTEKPSAETIKKIEIANTK
ncbi:MAG: sodium/proline symporter [Clostridia bacterium]|nr:sodium/proline symporter [Clostridia bacterium]